jgi:hypothetical protein
MSKKFPLMDKFIWYLNERWSIHQKRLKGLPPPWTDDYALQKYRFCQVRREDDRVTRWIHENWLRPHADDPNLWHAMYIARIYRPSALAVIEWPEPWGVKRRGALRRVRQYQRDDNKVFTAAYTLHCCNPAPPGDCKMTAYYEIIFNQLWQNRKYLQPTKNDLLMDFRNRLVTQYNIGNFMAAQIIADTKFGFTMCNASDWATFAVSGPGSVRGLNRLCGLPLNQRWREVEWHKALLEARKAIRPQLPKALRSLDAQNVEHGLCEFDKWCRVQEGGRPKQTYTVVQGDYQ